MSSLKDIACVTYTTSKYADLWPMYFGQLSKHLNGIKSYVLSDFGSSKIYNFAEHIPIEHDDAEPYWAQYSRSLELIPENFVIYCQEDFFLYADVNHDLLQKALEFLENSDYDYVRLVRCGYETSLKDHIENNFFKVDMSTPDAFSMQATLWKKSRMQHLYRHVASQKWLEGEHWNAGARRLNIKGVFTWNGEPKIGKFHYDSIIWPYICTGINKGQWNMDEYPEIMQSLVKEYNIDTSVRGIRKR